MPATPAARHTFTASSTLGCRPPRELRSVATLFTFTESRALTLRASSDVCLDSIDDFLGPLPDLVLVLSLEHHAQQRFGARVAHQQAPAAFEALLDARDRLRDGHDRGQIDLVADSRVQENLRIAHEIVRQFAERAAG